ncbi:MAG: HAD family phosphatase [Proteobacteria bacterium]|nr:HAD family phosphatase [Pseudomonadota bacterium]
MSEAVTPKISPAWKPAAVVFDCDGLLVDTESCWAVAEGEIFARFGLTFGPQQKAQLIGKAVTDEAREIARAVGGNSNARDIEIELLQLASQAISVGARAMPGAVSIVDRIGRVLPIGVASNSPRRLLDLALERGELARAFRATIAGDEVGAPKPAPDMYLEACRRLGVAPEQALAFEDSMTGVLAAKAAGMKVICIPTLKGLEYPADAVFDSLGDRRLLDWLCRWA